MADPIYALAGLSTTDYQDGIHREVTWDADEQVLRVETRDYNETVVRHYRLVEVEKQWTEVRA